MEMIQGREKSEDADWKGGLLQDESPSVAEEMESSSQTEGAGQFIWGDRESRVV